MRKIVAYIATALVAIAGVVTADMIINPASAKDCSTNAVVKCGVWSVAEMRSAYNNDRTPGTRNIFAGMGITSAMVNSSTVKEGTVGKDGRVIVGGNVVATSAVSAGRTIMSHTSQRVKKTYNGTVYYESPTSDSFRSSTLAAYVFLDNTGRFQGAVVKDCGNPVRATPPVVPPTPSKPPIASCKVLNTPVVTNRTNVALVAEASIANGATVAQYTFTIVGRAGNVVQTKSISTTNTSASTAFTINEPGSYSAKVVIKTSLGDKTAAACEKPFEIKPELKPGVSINKTVNGQEHILVNVNQPFTYELAVTNTGNVDLTDVKVTDPAPKKVMFKSADTGEIKNNVWSYTIPELKIGQTMKFTITAIATETSDAPIVNKACVDAPRVPGSPDDCDDATIELKLTACNLETGVIEPVKPGSENTHPYTTDLSRCRPAPVTPPTLPQTGLGDGIGAGLGLGSLLMATAYYVASRRNLMGL